MDLKETLEKLEQDYFRASISADGDFYDRNLSDDALLVFAETGALDKDACVQAVSGSPGDTTGASWRIEDARLVTLSPDAARHLVSGRSHPARRPTRLHPRSQRLQPSGWNMEARLPPADRSLIHRQLSRPANNLVSFSRTLNEVIGPFVGPAFHFSVILSFYSSVVLSGLLLCHPERADFFFVIPSERTSSLSSRASGASSLGS